MVGLKFRNKIKRKYLYDLIQSQQTAINNLCTQMAHIQDQKDYFKKRVDELLKTAEWERSQIPPVIPILTRGSVQSDADGTHLVPREGV